MCDFVKWWKLECSLTVSITRITVQRMKDADTNH